MKKTTKRAVILGTGMAAMAAFSVFGGKTDVIGAPPIVKSASTVTFENFEYKLTNNDKEYNGIII